MRALLDTHALVWAITAPELLGGAARAMLEDTDFTPVVSSVSALEIATKHHIGKWPDVADVIEHYGAYVGRLGAVRLALEQEHALKAGLLDLAHRDPFDRLLIAQALIEALPIVTLDPAMQGVPGLKIIW